MRVIEPDPDQPQLHSWWEPLILLARKARLAETPWLVDLGDFSFRGQVPSARSGPRPLLWVYQYKGSGLDVMCDDDGDTYRFVAFADSPDRGRIKRCDLDDAMFRAGVPFMPVEPSYDDSDGIDESWYDEAHAPRQPSRPKRPYRPRWHPHLRLLP